MFKLFDAQAATGQSRAIRWGGGAAEIRVVITGTATVILKRAHIDDDPAVLANYTEVDNTGNDTTFTATGNLGRSIGGPCYLCADITVATAATVTLEVAPLEEVPKSMLLDDQVA